MLKKEAISQLVLLFQRQSFSLSIFFIFSLGSYIYIETSSPRIQYETAILTFDGANPKPVVCLTFYYHMYGNYINELLLNNRGKNVWKLAGDQGDQWKKAQVTLTGNFQVQ